MPNRSSLYSNTGVTQLLAPANRTATATSSGIDLRHSDDVTLIFSAGAAGDTLSGSLKIEFEVQESDDNSTFTAVANSDLTNFETGTNVGTVKVVDAGGKAALPYRVGYKGSKRYVRGIDRRTGSHTTGTPTAIYALTGRNRYAPLA